ncbi:MAG: flagellin FliC3 [Lachnospiraceae bacterium]|nr:flagellin FliC3 [Candidatus Merdinaster equi]
MNVNYNVQSMVAQRALLKNENKLSAYTEKLSSGYKINHAKDDAAGLAISKKMRMQIRGLSQAGDNANNGTNVCETADGALAEIEDMLQRMNELAVKSATGTNTTQDREAIQEEVAQLKDEIVRISTQTDYNGNTLLDGTFDLHGFSDTLGVKVTNYTDNLPNGTYSITITSAGDDTVEPHVDAVATLDGFDGGEGGADFLSKATMLADGNKLTFTDSKGKELSIEIDPDTLTSFPASIELNINSIGAFSVQVGANEGELLDMRLPEISLKTLGIDQLDMTTQKGSQDAMGMLEKAIDTVSKVRSRIGAYQNRLEHTASSLAVTEENITKAESGIMDLDMSKEMVNFTTYQVLVQAGTSMLAQANQQPEQALQLLQ